MTDIVQTDHCGRVTLPSRPNETFLVCENSDGSILLQPAVKHNRAHPHLLYGTHGEILKPGTLNATNMPVYESGDDDELNSDA